MSSKSSQLAIGFRESLEKLKKSEFSGEIEVLDSIIGVFIETFLILGKVKRPNWKLKIKNSLDETITADDRLSILTSTYDYFKLVRPNIEIRFSKNKQFLLVTIEREAGKFLEDIGLKEPVNFNFDYKRTKEFILIT